MAMQTIVFKTALLVLCGVSLSHAHEREQDHEHADFEPLITACKDIDTNASCSAPFSGVCKSNHEGKKVCHSKAYQHGHGHHSYLALVKGVKDRFLHRGDPDDREDHEHHSHHGHDGDHKHKGHHDEQGHHGDHGDHDHHGHHKHHQDRLINDPAGDCEGKEDGESCSFERAGRCLPDKCEKFEGKQICKPLDWHPPAVIIEACAGKDEGEACRLGILAGECKKPEYEDTLHCVTWLSKEWKHHEHPGQSGQGSKEEVADQVNLI